MYDFFLLRLVYFGMNSDNLNGFYLIFTITPERKNKKKQQTYFYFMLFERLLKLYFRIRRVMFLMVVCFTNSGILLMLVFWHKFVKH